MRTRLLLIPLLAGLVLAGTAEGAQTPPPQTPPAQAPPATAETSRLRVYLDCDCFQTYLREEIDWVDFVRQPQDADVHLLSNSSGTGGGGREVVLRFVGAGRFKGADYELRVVTVTGEPENLRREAMLRTVSIGLLHYMARQGLPAGFDIDVRPPQVRPPSTAVRDRWNQWVFRVSGDASIDAEESNREMSWRFNLSADRVTEQWKISFGASADQDRETFDLDEDDPFTVNQREREFDFFLARSLGPHWSFGIDGRVGASTFGNTRFSARTAPAIEYSVFPYRDYATRQFIIQYEVGVEHAKYREITLFDRLEETLWRHELSARLDQRQPWGSLQAGVEWSQYLHDLSKNQLEVDGEISVRVARGLSFDVEGSASRIRDQLSLPRRSATPTEVLLRLRELRSGYEVRFSVGISYSFGSLFNNVVNPRFGG
jgi:hypothetical protein